jgi:hypothetical protein
MHSFDLKILENSLSIPERTDIADFRNRSGLRIGKGFSSGIKVWNGSNALDSARTFYAPGILDGIVVLIVALLLVERHCRSLLL